MRAREHCAAQVLAGAPRLSLEWAIGDAIVLGILLREWWSIRRELRNDAAERAAVSAREAASTPPTQHPES